MGEAAFPEELHPRLIQLAREGAQPKGLCPVLYDNSQEAHQHEGVPPQF